ncbi:thiol:disulfide interchange protein [Methylovorus sp. MM2]|uniref:DsbC family protein n=1 Tax=Methylovorus sp. MM2 TaxID=1848038 RepID=UPI0007DF20F9|nr:DsbC family protein [Methylovorus sp. MM2]OAM51411.1 thiol:disulfide interchange protein [Methylovorus sp. MM2]
MLRKTLGILLTALLTSSAFADEAGLRKAIEATYPKVRIESITKTPYAGLYEVFLDGQILYTDDKFNFLIAEGKLIDTKSKRDLTGERMDELTKVDFSSLPLDQAIKVVKGSGARKLVVFSDPDCPYCKRLEQKELVGMTDVTIYTFLYPLEQLHPDSANKSRAIWCSADRSVAWQDWILNGQLPKVAVTCDTPVEKTAELAKKLGITSTPTLIFADGKRMLGAYPAKDIEKAISNASSNKK